MSDITLTGRQKEVIDLTSNGLTDKEIAHQLGVSVSMVQQHLRLTTEKLGVKNVKQAIAQHVKNELICKIRRSGSCDALREFILQETDSSSLDDMSLNDGLFLVQYSMPLIHTSTNECHPHHAKRPRKPE